MKPMITRWGNPIPKWTKTHSKWSREWLIGVMVFVVIGIIYGIVRAIVVGPFDETIRNFPDIDAMFPVVWETALEENPDAQLLAMQIGSDLDIIADELEYENSFFFCSPIDSTWKMILTAEKRFKLFSRDVEVIRNNTIPVPEYLSENFLCSDNLLLNLNCDMECVINRMLSSLSDRELAIIDRRPRGMLTARTKDGTLQWLAVFKIAMQDAALIINYDAGKGEVVLVEEGDFPEDLK